MIDAFTGAYFFLSNFYPEGFQSGRLWYPTNEHYYQAMKSTDMGYRSLVADSPTPGRAKRLGSRSGMAKAGFELRPDWEAIKEEVMLRGLRLKFSIEMMEEMLLNTGDEEVVEGNHWHDNYWGACRCEACKYKEKHNRLGKLLMQVREEIRRD